MASALERGKLARLAARLNKGAGGKRNLALPSLILMTDDTRLVDPVAAAHALPKGSAIILRHRNAAKREILARALKAVAHRRGLKLLVADDAELALRIRADGLHLPEARIQSASHWRIAQRSWLVTVAAHSEHALWRAARGGAHAALLAPVFPTRSHPDANSIGPLRARLIAARAQLPVYALGGIGTANARRLSGAHFAGIAAIEGLIVGHSV